MAYSPNNPPLLLVGAFAELTPNDLSAGSSNLRSNLYVYRSSNSSTDITATGFFAGCGRNSRTGTPIGLNIGDLILSAPSTVANNLSAGLHIVISATINTSAATPYSYAYDCTVAAAI